MPCVVAACARASMCPVTVPMLPASIVNATPCSAARNASSVTAACCDAPSIAASFSDDSDAALPSFDQQASFRADYENHLAGKSVQGTLAQAQAWFERAREDFTGGIG